MREILFRGKRLDNGEWIDGSLCISGISAYIVYDKDFYTSPMNGESVLCSDRFFEVDPDTVGQFTSLSDEAGTKIYEGDIIKIRDTYGHKNGKKIIDYRVCDVSYSFGAMRLGGSMQSLSTYNNSSEVIGNIYDNSELLQEGQK